MPEQTKSSLRLYWLILIIISVLLGWYFYTQYYAEVVDWGGGKKQSIQVEELEDGSKLVRNVEEGVELVVSGEWVVNNKNFVDEKILVENISNKNIGDTELQDGAYIQVYTFDNPNNYSIRNWAINEWDYQETDLDIVLINDVEVLRSVSKVSFGDEDSYVKEDTIISDFSFVSDSKVYTYSCTVSGQNYEQYKNECENVIKNNIK